MINTTLQYRLPNCVSGNLNSSQLQMVKTTAWKTICKPRVPSFISSHIFGVHFPNGRTAASDSKQLAKQTVASSSYFQV